MGKDIMKEKVESLLKEIGDINWLIHAGEDSDKYTVVLSFAEAWDEWNDKMLEVWGKETGPIIAEGLVKFQDMLKKMGLDSDTYGSDYEIIDFIKRDLAWTCVEVVIGKRGFFSRVLEVLSEGRWPCAWDGSNPLGRFVVM